MSIPDYKTAVICLQENLRVLADEFGNVSPQDQPIWNVSNALLVLLDVAQAEQTERQQIQQQLLGIERRLLRMSEKQ